MLNTAIAIEPGQINSPAQPAPVNTAEVIDLVSGLLRDTFGQYRGYRKHIARAAGASPSSADNWVDGVTSPSLRHFINLCRHYPELRPDVERLLFGETEDFSRQFNDLQRRLWALEKGEK